MSPLEKLYSPFNATIIIITVKMVMMMRIIIIIVAATANTNRTERITVRKNTHANIYAQRKTKLRYLAKVALPR